MVRETTRKREEDLRKAALKVFCRKGYHYASIRDIAREVGIQAGSMYYYVTSKEDLLEDSLTSDMQEMISLIEQIANGDLPPEKKLREAVHAHMGFISEHLDGLGVFMQDWHSLSKERVSKITALRDYYEDLFRKIIQEGIISGDFRDTDVGLVTFAILGMCNYLFVWFSPNGKRSAMDIADAFANLLLDGLAACAAKEDERREHRSRQLISRRVGALRDALTVFHETQVQALAEIEQGLDVRENDR